MTAKQQRIFEYIKRYTQNEGYPPTLREICDGCHTCKSYVIDVLYRLEFLGLIEYHDGKHRAIKIIQE